MRPSSWPMQTSTSPSKGHYSLLLVVVAIIEMCVHVCVYICYPHTCLGTFFPGNYIHVQEKVHIIYIIYVMSIYIYMYVLEYQKFDLFYKQGSEFFWLLLRTTSYIHMYHSLNIIVVV